MGLFKKIKDIFYDEQVIEVPVETKEEIKPKIENVTPKREIIEEKKELENTFSERELFKPERTFNFPVFDDEEDEERKPIGSRINNVIELEKRPVRSEVKQEVKRNVREVREEKTSDRIFKPTPVISPIYGILDKNYKKEEIIQKKETNKTSYNDLNYDYVRRKAYGTLEDELENTLTSLNNEEPDIIKEDSTEEIELPSKPSKNIEDLLSEIEQNADSSIGEVEEAIKDKLVDEEPQEENEEEVNKIEKKEEKEDKISDDTLEHDLFNLIDSMYEDKEEE